MRSVLAFALLFLLPALCAAEDIYILTGSMTATNKYGERVRSAHPLLDRSFLDWLTTVNDFGEAQYRSPNGVLMVGEHGGFGTFGYKDVRETLNLLRNKGYRIRVVSKTTAVDLLKAVSNPETVGIFYVGHSHAYIDPDTSKIEDVLLSVYEGRKAVSLTPGRIRQAKAALGKDYHPSEKLQVFLNGSCFSGRCDSALRSDLELPPSVQMLSPSGNEVSHNGTIAKAFAEKIAPWANRLPQAKPSTSRFCFRRMLDWL